MAAKRIVSTADAELNTYRHAKEYADILPNGQEKQKAVARADEFKGRVNATRARGRPE